MPVDGNIPHRKAQQQKAERFAQAAQQGNFPPDGAAQPHIVGVYHGVRHRQIQKARQRKSHRRRIHADVIPPHRRQKQHRHGGDQIPLVHTVRQRKDARAVKARQQQRRKPPLHGAAVGKKCHRRRDQQQPQHPHGAPAYAAQGGRVNALPVAAQRRQPVEGVDRRIRVAADRTGVLAQQAGQQPAQPKKRQPRRQHRQHRQHRAGKAPPKGTQAILLQHDTRQKTGGENGTKQQRLRLDAQRNAVKNRRRQVVFGFQQQKAEQDRQRECPVDLLPDGGVKQRGGLQRGKRRQAKHAPPVRQAALPQLRHQPRGGAVADGRHQRQQHFKHCTVKIQLKDFLHRADRAQHIQVAGRVVGKIALAVKGGGTGLRHFGSPRAKAAHIVGVARRYRRQQQPQHKSAPQHKPESALIQFFTLNRHIFTVLRFWDLGRCR